MAHIYRALMLKRKGTASWAHFLTTASRKRRRGDVLHSTFRYVCLSDVIRHGRPAAISATSSRPKKFYPVRFHRVLAARLPSERFLLPSHLVADEAGPLSNVKALQQCSLNVGPSSKATLPIPLSPSISC
ncbi:uncharacterized protein ARMOST_02250 [Armillaria ostoyae]|uniref:Uncharacterized protein n=1 Tax=Armillaria ostoyae TaxID=47428 RepID=A0A284QRF1_ARMOS|nr:uncharacterized protein ARMOST_02250 [Armillaria ostoyae]